VAGERVIGKERWLMVECENVRWEMVEIGDNEMINLNIIIQPSHNHPSHLTFYFQPSHQPSTIIIHFHNFRSGGH